MWSSAELDLRAERFEQIRNAWRAAPDSRSPVDVLAERASLLKEFHPVFSSFMEADQGIGEFREFVDHWSRNKAVMGFGGPNGAMFLNQLAKAELVDEVEATLRAVLVRPAGDEEAERQLNRLAELVLRLRAAGSSAAVGRVAFFASWFWSVQDDAWRPLWPSVAKFFSKSAWLPSWSEQGERYLAYIRLLRAIADRCVTDTDVPGVVEIDEVCGWFQNSGLLVGMDPTLAGRCERSNRLEREPSDDPDRMASFEENRTNMQVVLAELTRVAELMKVRVAEALGRDVKVRTPTEYWVPQKQRVRGDGWASWLPQVDEPTPSVRLWVTSDGVYVVLDPEVNLNPKGFAAATLSTVVQPSKSGELQFFRWVADAGTAFLEPSEPDALTASFQLGLQLDDASLSDPDRLHGEIVRTIETLRPVLERAWGGGVTDGSIGTEEPRSDLVNLDELVQQFREELPYPSQDDAAHNRSREEFRRLLDPARIASLQKSDLRRIIASRYGSPGPQSILNTTIADADDEEWNRILTTIDYLCWDDADPFELRIDRALNDEGFAVRGLKESVILKFLAICHPDRFIPVCPFRGEHGKARLLPLLGRSAPALRESAGTRHVRSNDALRETLDPYLPGDPWGQMGFLYWLRDRETEGVETDTTGEGFEERLAAAAHDLYLDREFLTGIVELLENRGQVVFYGPPGTGKTFVARRLAEVIAPQPEQRMLVQFHPSTSYEDFFEGFRPETTADGSLSYRLVPGPLRLMADAAASDPDHRFVLVIDEINRANLPKVLGELLFLLEYRDHAARTLYRPEEEFQLPKNLWIIGTMNTADRSVALIDAALRRRFDFVPFVPDLAGRSPIARVLQDWVDRNEELETLPEIIDAVNNRLRKYLGGDYLLLGPSYFMKEGIDERALRRIWAFQVEPLVEDLFFGDPDRVAEFRFDRIWREFGPDTQREGEMPDAESTAADQRAE